MIIIAQTPTPDPVALAAWLGCLAFVLILLNNGAKLVDRLKGRPPEPPNESLHVTSQELARRMTLAEQKIDESDKRRKALYDRIESSGNHTRSMIDALKEQLAAGITALRREVKDDIDGLHEKINNVATAQGGHESLIEVLNQRLAQIDSKMEQRFSHLDEKLDRRFAS